MYKISSKRPAVVTGKTLKIRVKLPGRRIIARPNPVTGYKRRGVLPTIKFERKA